MTTKNIAYHYNNIASAHISAFMGDIAPLVILTSDFDLAYLISKKLLNVRKVSNVRGTPIYTGYLHKSNHMLSIVGTGMGLFPTGLYCEALFQYFNVKTIIKCDTCFSFKPDKLKVRDIVLIKKSTVHPGLAESIQANKLQQASSKLLLEANKIFNLPNVKGYCSLLYSVSEHDQSDIIDAETYMLYLQAKQNNADAISVLMISDASDATFLNSIERTYDTVQLIDITMQLASHLVDNKICIA